MVFSTNQNRQLYVALSFGTSAVTAESAIGTTSASVDKDGNFYIIQMGNGGLVRSDLIDPASITSAVISPASKTAMGLKSTTITLSSDCNGGVIIPGEDYILRVNFRQMYGMSDEDIYQKYGAVHATKAMAYKAGDATYGSGTADLFWLEMINSLVKNFKNIYTPLLDIAYLTTDADSGDAVATVVTSIKKVNGTFQVNGTAFTAGNTITGIKLIEKSLVSEWRLGVAQLEPVYFEAVPTTVFDDGDEVIWGEVTTPAVDESVTPIGNGYKYADLEYFCMGERADQYRGKNWPDNIVTKYMVDETQTYAALDIHYSYQGSCEDIQKSEKTITILTPATGDAVNVFDSLIAKLPYTVHVSAYDADDKKEKWYKDGSAEVIPSQGSGYSD